MTDPSTTKDGGEMAGKTLNKPADELASARARGLCLLSLDNGVLYGLSTLYVLKGIMDRLNSRLESRPPKKPCEVFDLIGGIGTGGYVGSLCY
jgi:patatin-like phospholipase/acyl hydrolase